jgi:hypothetical protein
MPETVAIDRQVFTRRHEVSSSPCFVFIEAKLVPFPFLPVKITAIAL